MSGNPNTTLAFTDPANWIGPVELAAILGLRQGKAGVYQLRHHGGDLPPCYKVGHNLRFYRPDVEGWLRTRRQLTATAQLQRRAEAAL